MSISKSQFEPMGVQMRVPKTPVSIKKVAQKAMQEFKDDSPAVLFLVSIVITGIGEIAGDMSWKWYGLMLLTSIFYTLTYYNAKIKPLSDLFHNDK